MQVRCWNIPDQKVVDWADVHEMVTAAAFSSEGSRAVVGTMRGKCRFYQVDTDFRLDYQAQIGEVSPPTCGCFIAHKGHTDIKHICREDFECLGSP